MKAIKINYHVNGPADVEHLKDGVYIDINEDEFHVNDGKFHRKNGPAIIGADNSSEEWVLNGKLHRTNGPAVIRPTGDVEWWLNGELYDNFDKWAKAVGIFDTDEFTMLKLTYG